MKAATFAFLLVVCGAVMRAQSRAAPSGDVKIKISEGTPEYCLGPHPSILLQGSQGGPNDITLRLPLRLRYENSVLKYKDNVDDDDFVMIPVLDRSLGWDLRGKTVQIVTTRDFRSSIAPDVVQKLNEKWKDYGTVWTRVVESDPLTIQIPQEPLTRNCMPKPLPR